MLTTIYTYPIALVTFLIIDMFWLQIAAKDLYKRSLGPLLSANPNLGTAFIFYGLYIAALLYFVIQPVYKDHNFTQALIRAAVFGGICYATYDLTNLAVINGWPVAITVIDIIWGIVLTTAVTAITLIIMQRLDLTTFR
ncbi:DUF2177 family protein [bacterium]|nr:DUF2177 family protein [bacterium]